MALDTRNAFKVGFLLRCAEAGVDPASTIKAADGLLKQGDGGILSPLTSLFKPVGAVAGNALGLAALGLPVGAGVLGGYLTHKATETPIDEQDVKDTELSDEYRRLARQARLNAKLKLLRQRIGTA